MKAELPFSDAAVLKRQEAELGALFDLIPAMIWFKDTKNRIVRVNQRAAESIGKTIQELEGKSMHEIYPAEADKYYADDLEVIRSKTQKLGVLEMLRDAQGRECWVRTNKIPYYNSAGELVGLVVMSEDITAARQRELALRESKSFLQATLDALSAHIAILDETGKILEVNRAWIRFAQENHYPGAACGVGDNYLHLCQAAAGQAVEAAASAQGIREVMAGTRAEYQLEYPCHSLEKQCWFILRVTRFAGPGAVRVVVAHENITERKQAERQVRQSEERYRSVVENARDAVFTIGLDGTFTSLNRAVETIAGVSRADWLGQPFGAMVHVEDLPLAREMFLSVLRGEHTPVHELRGNPNLKRPALMEMTLAAQKDEQGKIIGVLGIGRDITERKQIEAQLVQAQKLETVARLAGGIAHEFNGIMTAVIGQSDGLLEALPRMNPLRKKVIEIRQAADRAADLTRQLLAYGRKQILQPKIYDLNTILQGMETMLRHLMGRQVDLQMVIEPENKTVKVDAGQIEQVIVNIMMNAADAMPQGGQVTLETTTVKLSPEEATHLPDLAAGEYVVLAITDSGMGMSDEVKARIFEPFFSTKGVGRGTGLGLATCYGILKQSGGHVSVDTKPGAGSCFKIYLPHILPPVLAGNPTMALPNLRRGTETILLVEMDSALREMAATLLGRLGYSVLAATNGTEALNLLQSRRRLSLDLLLTDVALSVMNGRKLSDEVRSLYPEVRVLFVSPYTQSAADHPAPGAPEMFLQKPFMPADLANKVRQLLDARPMAAAGKSPGH